MISYNRDIYKTKSLSSVKTVKLLTSGYNTSVESSIDNESDMTQSTFKCKSESIQSSVFFEAIKPIGIAVAGNKIESSSVSLNESSSGYYSESNEVKIVSTDDHLNESSDFSSCTREKFENELKFRKVLDDIPEEVTIPDEGEDRV